MGYRHGDTGPIKNQTKKHSLGLSPHQLLSYLSVLLHNKALLKNCLLSSIVFEIAEDLDLFKPLMFWLLDHLKCFFFCLPDCHFLVSWLAPLPFLDLLILECFKHHSFYSRKDQLSMLMTPTPTCFLSLTFLTFPPGCLKGICCCC